MYFRHISSLLRKLNVNNSIMRAKRFIRFVLRITSEVQGEVYFDSKSTSTPNPPGRLRLLTQNRRDQAKIVFVCFSVLPGLTDFTIAVSNNTFDKISPRSVCYQLDGSTAGPAVYNITCWTPVSGRYLFVYRSANATELKLCEVKIYGGKSKTPVKMKILDGFHGH